MCGIAVFKNVNTNELCEELKESWTMMDHRGTDSFGLLMVKDNGVVKMLKALNNEDLLRKLKSTYKDDEFELIVAHNRKASIGSININLAHPIRIGNTIVIHNGTNSSIMDIVTDVESDTQAIASVIDDRNNYFVKRYIDDWLLGSGVIIAYDVITKKWLFWKDKTRPLVQLISDNYYYSEPVKLGQKYRIIENTKSLVEKKNFNNLFKKGKRFSVDDLLYPGYCNTCRRRMLINYVEEIEVPKSKSKRNSMKYIYGYGSYDYYGYGGELERIGEDIYLDYEEICWECRVLGKNKKYKK